MENLAKTLLTVFIIWYSIGFIMMIIALIKDRQKVLLTDVLPVILVPIMGPLLYFIFFTTMVKKAIQSIKEKR